MSEDALDIAVPLLALLFFVGGWRPVFWAVGRLMGWC